MLLLIPFVILPFIIFALRGIDVIKSIKLPNILCFVLLLIYSNYLENIYAFVYGYKDNGTPKCAFSDPTWMFSSIGLMIMLPISLIFMLILYGLIRFLKKNTTNKIETT